MLIWTTFAYIIKFNEFHNLYSLICQIGNLKEINHYLMKLLSVRLYYQFAIVYSIRKFDKR